MLNTKQLS